MKTISPNECSQYYWFDGTWYDLERLQQANIDKKPINFKDCSVYHSGFHSPFKDTITYRQHVFCISKDKYELYIMPQGSNNKKTIRLPVADPLPQVHEYYLSMLPAENGVIVLMENYYDTQFILVKYDEMGKMLGKTEIEHTFITHPEPATNQHHRYLYLGYTNPTELIFTSHMAFGEKDKTVVVKLKDFAKKEYDYKLSGIVLDDAQQYAKAFISKKGKEDFTLIFHETKKEIKFSIPNGDKACTTVLKGDLLVVANYHPISTGSSLYCFDTHTGKQVWKADVKQVNAAHSEYENHVYLCLYKNTIVMEGVESYGKYLQFFDLESGKRLGCFGIPDFTDK